jgi:hypothetical protein
MAMKWFKHMSDSHTNLKLRQVLFDFGPEGYGVYWICLELVAQQGNGFKIEGGKAWFKVLCSITGFEAKKIETMLRSFQACNLLEMNDGILSIPKMNEYADEYTVRKSREKGGSKSVVCKDTAPDESGRVSASSSLILSNLYNKDESMREETVTIGTLVLKKKFLDLKKKIYPQIDIEGEIRKCQDYHTSKGHKMRDWDKAITNWLKIAYDSKGVIRKDDGDWTEKYLKHK